MISNCINYAKRCQVRRHHESFIHQPPKPIRITCSWSFATWGMGVIRPFELPTLAGFQNILAATDYFSKWAEVVPLKESTKSGKVSNFIQTHLIYRFRVPDSIITENGQSFRSNPLYKLYSKYNIKTKNSMWYHATANNL